MIGFIGAEPAAFAALGIAHALCDACARCDGPQALRLAANIAFIGPEDIRIRCEEIARARIENANFKPKHSAAALEVAVAAALGRGEVIGEVIIRSIADAWSGDVITKWDQCRLFRVAVEEAARQRDDLRHLAGQLARLEMQLTQRKTKWRRSIYERIGEKTGV
jgi:hypothetical protein